MSKVSKRTREALDDRELARDSKAKKVHSEQGVPALRAYTPEERALRDKLIIEVTSGKPGKDSITAQTIDLDVPEEALVYDHSQGKLVKGFATNSRGQTINRGQYMDQENEAYRRDISNNWQQVPSRVEAEDGTTFDILETGGNTPLSRTHSLSPFRQLAIDIIAFKFDQHGKQACLKEIEDLYKTEASKKYANMKDLNEWKANCEAAIRKITSSKNHWKKIQSQD